MGVSVTTFLWLLSATSDPLPLGDRLAPYRGQPIVSIDIDAPSAEDVEELRVLIDIQPGYLLSTTDLQAAVKRLYALGRFANVRIHAQRLSGAVLLRFELQPLRRLGALELDGLELASGEALLTALGIRQGDEVDRRTRAALEERARAYLTSNGFPNAQVTVEESSDEPQSASYVVSVEEGSPLRIGRVLFGGARRVREEALRGVVRTKPGAILDKSALDADRLRLEEAYLARGFLQAQVGEPELSTADGTTLVSFPVNAGPRIQIVYSGNHLVTTESLRRMWPEANGRLRSGTLRLHTDRIAKHYRRLGFNDVRVSTRGFRDHEHGLVRYAMVIDEGEPMRVASLTFAGAQAIAPELLTDHVRAVLRQSLQQAGSFQQLDGSESDLLARGRPPFGGTRSMRELESPVPPEGRWVPELYDEALRGIRAVYRDRGFLSVSVGAAEPSIVGREVHVRVVIDEGPQSSVGSIRFQNNTVLGAAELLDTLAAAPQSSAGAAGLQLGMPYSARAVEDARIALIRRYRDLGYLYAQIFTQASLSEDRKNADVVFRVEEGPQVRIRTLLVRGNNYTSEGIIRSRITLAPGDIYRLEQAVRDQRSIAALGVFSSVRVKLIDEERPSEGKDVVAEVVERNRQPVEVVPGVSTADGPRLRASYSHINVLGSASTLTLSGKANRQLFFGLYGEHADSMRQRYDSYEGWDKLYKAIERDLRLGLRSPRFTNVPFDPSARIDLLTERENAIPYSLDTGAAVLGFDFVLGSAVNLAIEPQFSISRLECPFVFTDSGPIMLDNDRKGDECEQAATLQRGGDQKVRGRDRLLEAGQRGMIKVGPALTLDLRDNPFNPSAGLFASAAATYAAGRVRPDGDEHFSFFSFTKLEGSLFGYVPALGAILVLGARFGAIQPLEGSGVPIDERFFIGGRDTLRGYVEQTLIPEDACVVGAGEPGPADCAEVLSRSVDAHGNEQPAVTRGGNVFLLLKSELRLPLSENVSLDLFVDSGNLWVERPEVDQLALRVSMGAGLRYNTPVGALVLDLGVNPSPRPERSEERVPQLHFSVGSF